MKLFTGVQTNCDLFFETKTPPRKNGSITRDRGLDADIANSVMVVMIRSTVLLSFSLFFVEGGAVRTPAVINREINVHDLRNGTDGIVSERKEVRRRNEGQQYVVDYELWEASRFPKVLKEWEAKYPDLIRVTTAQEAFGLPAAGNKADCPFYEKEGCPNYFFTLQDYIAHPVGSSSSSHLPEVFWSGCLHGNERVGPTSVMEASALLLEAAYCESLPRQSSPSLSSDKKEAKICRDNLRNKGIDDVNRQWLARLVTTRRIVVVPTTNGKSDIAIQYVLSPIFRYTLLKSPFKSFSLKMRSRIVALGYYRNRREEGPIDPNRDFPYDLNDNTKCMQTIAGRTANEIYREHMFQLALTFHGGMEVVAYEWGAPSWLGHLSPDDTAQSQIGAAYSRYGGGWRTSKPYDYGTMNDMVYYVQGGMEDCMYEWNCCLILSSNRQIYFLYYFGSLYE